MWIELVNVNIGYVIQSSTIIWAEFVFCKKQTSTYSDVQIIS